MLEGQAAENTCPAAAIWKQLWQIETIWITARQGKYTLGKDCQNRRLASVAAQFQYSDTLEELSSRIDQLTSL